MTQAAAEAIRTIRAFPAGRVAIPPSKSLGHRALICAGLAALGGGGQSRLENVGQSEDIDTTMACMAALGVHYRHDGNTVLVSAAPKPPTGSSPAKAPVLNCGESGSTLRFILPIAALSGTRHTFTGRGRLMVRPMAVYQSLFAEKGLLFEQSSDTLTVQGPLPPGTWRLPGDVSSQFISGLLLALPLAGGPSRIELTSPLESQGYVALTLAVMEAFGVKVQATPTGYAISGSARYHPTAYRVEGDWSQAAFFLAAGALGRPVRCGGMAPSSGQGDAAIVDLLHEMGVTVRREGDTLWAEGGGFNAIEADVREVPDLVPPLAALCCFAKGTSRLTGAARLRLKESDRLAALASELRKLGATIEEGADTLTITGKPHLAGGAVEAHGDHRIAMALAVAAIGCTGPVHLSGWENVKKSYPGFWADFEKEARDG